MEFKAMQAEEVAPKQFTRSIVTRSVGDLPAGDLLIRVLYSSLNYKDALSALGRPGVTRRYPHTPGIDAVGNVVSSADQRFTPGEMVLVTGYDLGMDTAGGFGQYIRVPADWALAVPAGLSARQSMIYGTAGLTAGLCVHKLRLAGVTPEKGDVVVTGATGGVGCLAVAILARLGYRVIAATGKSGEADFLHSLGAAELIGREDLLAGADRPLMKERFAGAIDVVGGTTLAAVLKATRYGGSVTCCGLAGSPDLPATVLPFILRGISLLGVDSVQCPSSLRRQVWQHLAEDWRPAALDDVAVECTLETLEPHIQAIIKGSVRGRVVVSLA